MNSIKRKFQYRFRIHNRDELDLIEKLIKRRRIGALNYEDWVEFNNYDSFLEWVNNLDFCDFMIRVYFSTDHKRYQFQKRIREILPKWVCGNDNCEATKCRYHIYKECNSDNPKIEYLWRCILADERHIDEED